jgi:hypothetical protein
MIKFGPSGNGDSFFAQGLKHSEESAVFVKKLNLDCFEYSFGRGVNLRTEKAISIGNAFKENGVELSVHAPYFINLANPDDEMAEKWISRQKCKCWQKGHWFLKSYDTCLGTREKEPCSCKGDRNKCDFYGKDDKR